MANVLGELFQNIANAIREKTGDTESMSPSEFPTKIGEIEVGGGSAGGALPAGIYAQQITKLPVSYVSGHFVFGNELYLYFKAKTSNDASIYKFSGSTYTLVVSFTCSCSSSYMSFVEFNGKMHLLGGDNTLHGTFDGTTFTNMNSLPNSTTNENAFIFENELYIRTRTYGLYKWIESSDTWEQVALDSCPTGYTYVFMHDGTPYTLQNSNVYKYDIHNGTCSVIKTLDASYSYSGMCLLGDYFYFVTGSSGKHKLYKYDIINQEVHELPGYLPFVGSSFHLYVYNDKIHIASGVDTAGANMVIYEVE